MKRVPNGDRMIAAGWRITACDKSKPELDRTIVQMQQISAEKDSLLKDVMQTSQFIADVNTQLATVKSRNASKPVKGAAAGAESSLTPAAAARRDQGQDQGADRPAERSRVAAGREPQPREGSHREQRRARRRSSPRTIRRSPHSRRSSTTRRPRSRRSTTSSPRCRPRTPGSAPTRRS